MVQRGVYDFLAAFLSLAVDASSKLASDRLKEKVVPDRSKLTKLTNNVTKALSEGKIDELRFLKILASFTGEKTVNVWKIRSTLSELEDFCHFKFELKL